MGNVLRSRQVMEKKVPIMGDKRDDPSMEGFIHCTFNEFEPSCKRKTYSQQ